MAKQTFTTGQVLTAAQMTSLQQTAMGGGSTTAKVASYVLVAADAGTVVQMNAAGATTITVNTALFAAGDSVQIQNVGSGVCTVTAGTATVSTAGSLALSQYEGGQLYFNTTSAALFFDIVQTSGMTNPMTTTGDIIYSSSGSTPARLGIGSTGQVVTVASGLPSWATPAGGGKVLQVVSTTYSTYASNATTTFADTGLTLSITPTLATSRVLVLVSQLVTVGANSTVTPTLSGILQLVRVSTAILVGTQNVRGILNNLNGYFYIDATVPIVFLDSPATTSSTAYKTQFKSSSATAGTIGVQDGNQIATMTLLEIGA